jgi:hypothetical protein
MYVSKIQSLTHLALLCLLGVSWSCSAEAAPMQASMTFGSTGTIGTQGLTGTPAVAFRGIENGLFTSSDQFSIGEFVVNPASAGSVSRYDKAPFEIDLNIGQVNGSAPTPNAPIRIFGNLSGTVSAAGPSSLSASFEDVIMPTWPPIPPEYANPVQIGDLTLHTLMEFGGVPLNAANGGTTPVQARIDAYPAPEPATAIIFLLLFAAAARIRRRPIPSLGFAPSK